MLVTSRLRAVLSRRCLSAGPTFNKTSFREPDPSKPKLVLAYSGGLDTSCQLSWLVKEKGFEVCAYIANLGQDDVKSQADIDAICEKAEQSGAYSFYCEDLKDDFARNYIFKAIKGNGLYENRYLLGTSVARPCIGKRQVEICWEEGARHISHGSTGKGNDQVRFELCYLGMDPTLQCVTLWRDREYLEKFEGRQALIDYATACGIPVSATKKHSYSEDENMMHISYESGELEDPAFPGHAHEYPGLVLQKKSVDIDEAPSTPARLTLDFEKGEPVRVRNIDDGTDETDPVRLFQYLNEVGGQHGVGRIDIVENRFIGMKSRGCYETPGGTILHAAARDLEVLCLDREVHRLRDSLSIRFADLIYNGYWFSPEMDFLMASMEKAQEVVTGSVDLHLYKGNVLHRGRSSPLSLYDQDLVSMDVEGGFNPEISTGFIQTCATRLKASAARAKKIPSS